jgi:glutaredoxin
MNRVTLYSKPGCHLCDRVKEVIEQVRQRRAFELEVRNIETDAADFERYRNDIPVVTVNGNEIARHRLSDVRLEWGLDTYGQSE